MVLLGHIGNLRFVSCAFSYFKGINLSQLFEYEEQSLRILFHLPIADVRHAVWLDHDSYAISFEVANYIFSFGVLPLSIDIRNESKYIGSSMLTRITKTILATIKM